MIFIQYPKCSTCIKAKKWLDDRGIEYKDRHILEDTPTKEELKRWHSNSKYLIKRFFNTSGTLYREKAMKDRIPEMSEDEIYETLASYGMLIKRPILVGDDFVLLGFKEKEWEEHINPKEVE